MNVQNNRGIETGMSESAGFTRSCRSLQVVNNKFNIEVFPKWNVKKSSNMHLNIIYGTGIAWAISARKCMDAGVELYIAVNKYCYYNNTYRYEY